MELLSKERVWACKDEGGERIACMWEKSMFRSIEIRTREPGEAMGAGSHQTAGTLAQRTYGI